MKAYLLTVLMIIGLFAAGTASAQSGKASLALTPDAAKDRLEEVLKKSDYTFTSAVRKAYIDYAVAVTRAKYGPNKINDRTWAWLMQRPQVLSAAAAADYPVEPNILLNFQRLCLALGQQNADRWRQLALAYAIRYRDTLFPIDRVDEEWDPARLERAVSQKRGKGGDFVFQTEDDLPEATDEEKALGAWVAKPPPINYYREKPTIPELMQMPVSEINMVTRMKPTDPQLITKFPDWEKVALWGRLYPVYFDCTPTPQRAILMKIFRNGRIPGKTNRPNFKMAEAEWPILLYLADLDEIDETSFIFGWFVSNKSVPPTGLGEGKTFGGSGEMTPGDLNFRFAGSNWNPRKFIRIYNGIKKDQGGRSWAWCMRALNVAATEVNAPPDGKFYYMGGKGNYTYYMQCADNSFTGQGSTARWALDRVETVDPTQPARGDVPHTHFMGLAMTVNQGLEAYENARMAIFVMQLFNLPTVRRISMLESVFMENPLNGDVLYLLAAEYRRQSDAKATLKMLAAARAYAAKTVKLPVTSGKAGAGRASMQKIMKSDSVSMMDVENVPVGVSPWFFLVCNDIAVQYLRDCGRADKGLFADELAYESRAVGGNGDAPLQRALETLGSLVR